MTNRQENFILLMYVIMREVSKSDGKVDLLESNYMDDLLVRLGAEDINVYKEKANELDINSEELNQIINELTDKEALLVLSHMVSVANTDENITKNELKQIMLITKSILGFENFKDLKFFLEADALFEEDQLLMVDEIEEEIGKNEDKFADKIFEGCEQRNPTFHKWVLNIVEDYIDNRKNDPMELWEVIKNEFSEDFFKDDETIKDFFESKDKDEVTSLMFGKSMVMQYLLIECETLANFLDYLEGGNLMKNFKKIELYYSVVELCRKFYGEEQSQFFDNQTRNI